jgi:hypothetical protein
MLYQLFYLSHSTHNRGHLSDLDILETSRKHNLSMGVTGFLLRAPTAFFQCLEGTADAVQAIMTEIRKDPRHSNVNEFATLRNKPRDFGAWTMGYSEIESDELTKLQVSLTRTNQDLEDMIDQMGRLALRHAATSVPQL